MAPGRTARAPSLALAASLLSAPMAMAAGPHQHGVAALALALDGSQLRAELTLPARDAVGFERQPRTDAERARIHATRDRLADGIALLGPSALARCALTGRPEIKSELLTSSAAKQGRHSHIHGEEHADFDVVYLFACADPAALTGIEPTLFKAFPGLKQIRVQAVGPKGPKRTTLTPARARFAF